jgi:hypothetical protein
MTKNIPDGEMSEFDYLKAHFVISTEEADANRAKAARVAAGKARRRITRMKAPDIRAMAYFVEEMRDQDGRTICAALRWLNSVYSSR